jgi:hypothetical protein
VELTLRINGISDAASTAEAIGVPAVELAAALQWTRIHRMQQLVFAGAPFTDLTPKAAHVWAATMAHCIASSMPPQSDLIPPHNRLLDFVPAYKFQLEAQTGTYMRRHVAANSTFQMLCAKLGATGWRTAGLNFEIPSDYGLESVRRSAEQQAAIDWATWLDQEPPVCMAGHILSLHAEDLQVLIALARTAWAGGRRGTNSLYGIVVRAVYHAFTLFVLQGPPLPSDMPAHFPVGLCHSRIEWIPAPIFPLPDRGQGGPDLSLGEALAIVRSFGKRSASSPPHPRFVGGRLLLAPADTIVTPPEQMSREEGACHLAEETWLPERFYQRRACYWSLVCTAAEIWVEAGYMTTTLPSNGGPRAALVLHLSAMIAGRSDCPATVSLPPSDAERARARSEHQEGATTIKLSLARARAQHPTDPCIGQSTGALANPAPAPRSATRSGRAAPSPGAARQTGGARPRPPERSAPTSSPLDLDPSLQFVNDSQRAAYLRATFTALTSSVGALRDSVAQMPEPHIATGGDADHPPLVQRLRAQMGLVADALTEITLWMEVSENQTP